jgi:hypothetical protein
VQVGHVEELLQLPHGDDVAGLIEAVKLHDELIDSLQDVVGGTDEAVPLRTLDVHLDDQVLSAVAVFRDLIGQRVERAMVFDTGDRSDALAVKDRPAARAPGRPEIEAVVLVHRDREFA